MKPSVVAGLLHKNQTPPPEGAEIVNGPASLRWSTFHLDSRRCFVINAVVVFALLFIAALWMNTGSIAVPDDGVYTAQVKLVSMGKWSMSRPAADIDGDGANSALFPETVYRDRQIPYARHPAFTVSMVPFYRLGGYGGLMLYSVIGAWGSAVSAGLIARQITRLYGVPALWLTGIASPIVFDAFLISALTMAAAATGLATLCLSKYLDSGSWRPLPLALASLSFAVCLRSEAAIVVAMTAIVIGAMSLAPMLLRSKESRHINWRGIVLSLAVLIAGLVAYVVDASWTRTIVQPAGLEGAPLVRTLKGATGPASAAWASLVRPWDGSFTEAQIAMSLSAVAMIASALALKIGPRRWLLPLGLLTMSTVSILLQLSGEPVRATGLFAAFPILAASLILLNKTDLKKSVSLRCLSVSLLSIVAIVLTTYSSGGAAEWGGRFFHIVLPLLIPLVIVGLVNGYRKLPSRVANVAVGMVVVSLLSTTAVALRGQMDYRLQTKRIVEAVANHSSVAEEQHMGGEAQRPLLIVARFQDDGMPRSFWNPPANLDVIRARGITDVFRLVIRAEAHGYQGVTVLSDIDPTLVSALAKKPLAKINWSIIDSAGIKGTSFAFYRIGAGRE